MAFADRRFPCDSRADMGRLVFQILGRNGFDDPDGTDWRHDGGPVHPDRSRCGRLCVGTLSRPCALSHHDLQISRQGDFRNS